MERTKTHFQFLDYIRGIAILAVFLYHCLGAAFGRDQLPWGNWFRDFSNSGSFLALLPATFGWAGVSIFFVVSGFCIHLSFLRGSPGDWREFYVKRFFRIYPPYLLALIVFAVAFPTTRLSFSSLTDWAQIGSHLLLLHNFDQRSFFGINPSFWSIAVEAQLYFIYPALLALVNSIGWRYTLIFLGSLEILMRGSAGIISVLSVSEAPRWFTDSPVFYWYSWSIGAALADAYAIGRPLPFSSLSAPVLFLLAIGTSFFKPLAPFSFLLFALLTATVIAKLAERGQSLPINKSLLGHLHVVGLCSYSFYLLHQPVIATIPLVLHKLWSAPIHPLVVFISCVCAYPLILTLSWLYYRHCELNGMAFGKLFLRGGKDFSRR
jgi:peptidoglycan/LPS O-acetylase OafA/YrhL